MEEQDQNDKIIELNGKPLFIGFIVVDFIVHVSILITLLNM